MSQKRASRALILGVLAVLAFPAACGSSGVVGGHCRANYRDCNGRCVDAQNDPDNCGACALRCRPGDVCQKAICGHDDASAGSGGMTAAAGAAGESAAGGVSGSAGNSGAAGDATGGAAGAAGCSPPFDSAQHCGDCATQCKSPKPLCTPNGLGSFECVLACNEPLVKCGEQCVPPPPYDSPARCGTCDNDCGGATPLCAPDGNGSFECVAACAAPLVLCGGKCVNPPPYDSAAQCGTCDAACADPTPACSPNGAGGYECVKVCVAPLLLCSGQCVDENIDPDHCGSCANACPSGICQGGTCVGANVGHQVLACMDYSQPTQTAPQTVLLGNTVFLPVRSAVRILAYTEFAPAAVRTKVNTAIGYAATARGRTFTITPAATAAAVTAQLNIKNFEVFLVYDQSLAPSGQLASVGAAWQSSTVLSSFSAAGGVVLVLDGGGGTGEMPAFLSSSDLLPVSAQTDLAAATLYNRAPADAVGINVISPFLAQKSTCSFSTTLTQDAANIFVISDAKAPLTGAPVVVHRVIEP